MSFDINLLSDYKCVRLAGPFTAPCSNFNIIFHEINHILLVHLLEILINMDCIMQNGKIFLGH